MQPQTWNTDVPQYDALLSLAKIREMKKAGFSKPPHVSWGDWMGPQVIDHRHEILIYLASIGKSNKDIAKATDLTESRVSILLSNSQIKAKIEKIQKEIFSGDHKKRFGKIVPVAIKVAEDVMLDEKNKESVRLKAAHDFLDRSLGKPKEKIEHEAEVKVRLIYDRLDALEREEKDITPDDAPSEIETDSTETPTEHHDDVDRFLLENQDL